MGVRWQDTCGRGRRPHFLQVIHTGLSDCQWRTHPYPRGRQMNQSYRSSDGRPMSQPDRSANAPWACFHLDPSVIILFPIAVTISLLKRVPGKPPLAFPPHTAENLPRLYCPWTPWIPRPKLLPRPGDRSQGSVTPCVTPCRLPIGVATDVSRPACFMEEKPSYHEQTFLYCRLIPVVHLSKESKKKGFICHDLFPQAGQ